MQKLRVEYLAGYGLEVPDLEVANAFYSAFGLESEPLGDVRQLRAAHHGPADIILLKGAQKKLHHLSFAIRDVDTIRFAEHLKASGVPATTPPFGTIREGLWFQDYWGTWINLVPVQTNPPLLELAPLTIQPRVDRHYWQELERETKPNRLGHLLMFTHDCDRVEAFFLEVLGMRIADRVQGKVTFLSAGTGIRDHHCFGLIPSTHRGLQHSSFSVDSVDAIGFGALQMQRAGYKEGFGLGRHALASNLFYYIRDPWGSWVEYYSDMDKISESWETRDWNGLPYIWPEWAPEFWSKEMNGNLEPRG